MEFLGPRAHKVSPIESKEHIVCSYIHYYDKIILMIFTVIFSNMLYRFYAVRSLGIRRWVFYS